VPELHQFNEVKAQIMKWRMEWGFN